MSQSTAIFDHTSRNHTWFLGARSEMSCIYWIKKILLRIHHLSRNMRRNIFFQTTSISSLLLRSLQFAITAKICSIGLEWSCVTYVERTTREVGFDNAHITSAASGKNSRGNLPSPEGVGAQNTAARNARRALGFITATGV